MNLPTDIPCIQQQCCEPCVDLNGARKYAAYKAVAFQEAATLAMAEATDAFERGKDDEAHLFRNFSAVLKGKAEELREEQEDLNQKTVECEKEGEPE